MESVGVYTVGAGDYAVAIAGPESMVNGMMWCSWPCEMLCESMAFLIEGICCLAEMIICAAGCYATAIGISYLIGDGTESEAKVSASFAFESEVKGDVEQRTESADAEHTAL